MPTDQPIENLQDYLSQISFRFIKPDKPASRTYRKFAKKLQKMGVHLDIYNTRLPSEGREAKRNLVNVCKIERMSTFAIGAIINKAVARMSDAEAYVNIGVWKGFTFFAGLANNPDKVCIGVDNFSEFMGPKDEFLREFEKIKSGNHHFFEMDYIEYFNSVHTQPIGFYIYDGEHSYENQLKGLQVAEPFFADDCLIMVDDTNLDEARQATLDFIAQSKHKYEMIFDQSTAENMHPTFWNGVMLLYRKGA